MKKISVLLIVLMIITALTSCGDSDSIVSNDNQNGSNVIYEVITAKNFELYADHGNPSYGESANSIATVFKDSKEQGVGYIAPQTSQVSSVSKTKELKIAGNELSYYYHQSTLPDEKYSDVCPLNGDCYTDLYFSGPLGNVVSTAEFLHGTDVLVSYYFNDGTKAEKDLLANLKNEELFDMAEKFLLNFFAREELADYARLRVTTSESNERYWVVFERLVNGYGTEDRITVLLRPDGVAIGFTAPERKRYSENTLPNNLTKEQIDAVNDSALKQLNELKGYTVTRSTPQIVMNGKGELFLEYVVEPYKEAAFLESVYVKLTNRLENATE